MKTIVLAWAEKTKLVPTGRHVMRDLNWFPEFKTDWEGRAAIWLNRGTDEDEAKARDYAAQNGHMVLTYPTDEKNPLQKAREAAVRAAQ